MIDCYATYSPSSMLLSCACYVASVNDGRILSKKILSSTRTSTWKSYPPPCKFSTSSKYSVEINTSAPSTYPRTHQHPIPASNAIQNKFIAYWCAYQKHSTICKSTTSTWNSRKSSQEGSSSYKNCSSRTWRNENDSLMKPKSKPWYWWDPTPRNCY